MPTLDELAAQREQLASQLASLDSQLQEIQRAQKQSAIEDIRQKIDQAGLLAEDIFPGLMLKAAAPAKRTRGAAPPKYRDPKTNQTWSGRGKNPRWLTEAMAAGAKIEDFKV